MDWYSQKESFEGSNGPVIYELKWWKNEWHLLLLMAQIAQLGNVLHLHLISLHVAGDASVIINGVS